MEQFPSDTDFQFSRQCLLESLQIKPLLLYSGGITFMKQLANTKLVIFSQAIFIWKEVALTPEQPEFLVKAGRVATLREWSTF